MMPPERLPFSAQIDPLRLGEMQRTINIAKQYGERLRASAETLDKLIGDYHRTAL